MGLGVEGRSPRSSVSPAPHHGPTSLLQPASPASRLSGVSLRPSLSGHLGREGVSPGRNTTHSLSSNENTLVPSGLDGEAEVPVAHRDVRTLPSWVRSYDIDDEDADSSHSLLPSPAEAQVAQHNHSPSTKHKTEPGRLHDGSRDRIPVTINLPPREQISRWKDFASVSAIPPRVDEQSEKMGQEWLGEHLPNLEGPWNPDGHALEQAAEGMLFSSRKRKEMWKSFLRGLMNNPMVPLIFRLIIWIFSLTALALGASIYTLSRQRGFAQRPSTLMAIIFDAIALIYGMYITYDEYSGKPLGLRSPAAKMLLILLDLFFIVFNSANLSLAFDALYDERWTCSNEPVQASPSSLATVSFKDEMICARQQTLSSMLLIVLIAWLLTFTVSVFRLVERVNRD
ncbi:MAG: hypothetical protein M1838_003957 [Thelocarpon superellum]|nr:MAG: hypothetical protein M1838_003957 [Thelocarpon superellum]